MSLPTTRRQLKDWVLKRLGEPVIQINIDPQQCEDRICEAISYFSQYHFDGVEDWLLKHKITASIMKFALPVVDDFTEGETITGLTSGATITFISKAADNLSAEVVYVSKEKSFVANETVKGENSGTVGVLTSTEFLTFGDVDNEFIPVEDDILSVNSILPFNQGLSLGRGIFNVRYQYTLNSLPNLVSMDIVSYDMFRRHLSLLDFELNVASQYRFNRVTGKIYLDIDWKQNIYPGDYIIVEAKKIVNPDDNKNVYGNWYLLQYAYLLFKLQWGNNLKKYAGVPLASGITLNGQQIYDEAMREMEELEKRLQKEFQMPMGDIFMA